MSVNDEISRKGKSDAELLPGLLDSLPIFATRIGYRFDSTEAEKQLGRDLFVLNELWRTLPSSAFGSKGGAA